MKTSLFGLVAGFVSFLTIGLQGNTLYVSLNSPNPTPPYSSWATASTNIQVAIEAANPGDTVLVTNGLYNTGGEAMSGTLTNRIALDRALTVQSVNGPFVTVIQGAGATNGTSAVRCAWLTNNATLIGFTLTAGRRKQADLKRLSQAAVFGVPPPTQPSAIVSLSRTRPGSTAAERIRGH